MTKWWGFLVLCAVLTTAPVHAVDPVNEDTYCDVELTFADSANLPGLPPSFAYTVHDKGTSKKLLAQTTVNAPTANCLTRCVAGTKKEQRCTVNGDCPGSTCANPAGCTSIRLPASAQVYVGLCNTSKTPCTSDADCTPKRCERNPGEVSQQHTLSGVASPGPNQQAFWVDIPVRNGLFVPLQ